MATASAQAPPVVHAIGGSLGSALALLIFYPLERARIELQSSASRATPASVAELDSVESEIRTRDYDETPKVVLVETKTKIPPKEIQTKHMRTSDSSWISEEAPIDHNENKVADLSPTSWSGNSTSTSQLTIPKRRGLIDCLVQLHKQNSLYTGVTPVVTTIFTSQFVFFYMHALVKRFFRTSNKKSSSALLSLLSSCLAGLGNVVLTNPLWVVNMAIVTGETKTSALWKELYIMIKERGLKHMWNGTSASILLVSNPVIQFFCYEQMKVARSTSVLPPIEAFVIGAMAKGIATITTYPLQLAQTLLRLKENGYNGTCDCLLRLYKEGKLFTGMRAKLLQTVLTAAFTFLTYEQILGVVHSALIKSGKL